MMQLKQFEPICISYFPGLKRYVDKIIANEKEAREIVFEVLMELWSLKYDLGSEKDIKNYLCMHARHAVIDYLKKINKAIEVSQIHFDDIENLNEDHDQEGNYIIQELYEKIEGLPHRLKNVVRLSMAGLETPEIANMVGSSRQSVVKLKSRAHEFLRRKLNSNVNDPSDNILKQVCVIRDEICEELIKYLARHPNKLYDLDPYKFERLVAELIRDMGYDVYITSRTRDGGKDIIAVLKTPSNDEIVTIVECKRYRADRPIGITMIKSFLNTIRDQDKVNAGWIVTTSTFSAEVIKKQKEDKWLLSLKDSKNLETWCSNYGQWKQSGGSGGLWLPNNPLTV
jgi:RNA polymerase sigma factor (sigma-70 family)